MAQYPVSRGFSHVQVFVVAVLLCALSGVSEAFVNVAGGWQIVQSSPLAGSGVTFVQQGTNGNILRLTGEYMHYNYGWGSWRRAQSEWPYVAAHLRRERTIRVNISPCQSRCFPVEEATVL